MVIEINQTTDAKIWLNDKLVVKGTDNQWSCKQELTPSEETALADHLRQIGEL